MSERFDQKSIFHWHLELSSKCALKCPRCPRTMHPGMYAPSELSAEFIESRFNEDTLRSVERILLCGGEGDPIYCKDFLKIISYFKRIKPKMSLAVVTNGSYKDATFWEQVSQILNEYDSVTFSVDGWDQHSNSQYRVNSDWDSMSRAVKIMSGSRAYVYWSTIVFAFNERHLDRIKDVAKNAGADSFLVTLSTLFGSKNRDFIDPKLGYDPLEPSGPHLSEIARHTRSATPLTNKAFKTNNFMQIYRDRFRERSAEKANDYIMPLCQIGDRGMYINAEGFLHPCSWVSHPYSGVMRSVERGQTVNFHDSWAVKNRDRLDLKKTSLEEIFADPIWVELENSFKSSADAHVMCEKKCAQKNVKPENLRFTL